MHRLNRTEYANAIRDLLALDVDVAALLPADDSSEGFDNIADALERLAALIQGYVSAAMKISRRAVGDRTLIPVRSLIRRPAGCRRTVTSKACRSERAAACWSSTRFRWTPNTRLHGGGGGGGGGGRTSRIDGDEPVQVLASVRIQVTAGPHTIAARSWIGRGGGVDEQYSDFRVNSVFTVGGGVNSIVITGPSMPTGPGDTPSRRRIFVCHPQTASEEATCARQIVTTLARRAFRRLVDDAKSTTLMAFYQRGRKDGDFETGIQQALARILVAPRFLYRVEEEPAGSAGRRGLSFERSGAGFAVVVLSVEQHPRRRTSGPCHQGPAQ